MNSTLQTKVKTIIVSDLLRVEMMYRFMLTKAPITMFETYYLLVCCSDGGVLRDRKYVAKQIIDRLKLKRSTYDTRIDRMKRHGLIRTINGVMVISGAEDINWDEKPEGLLFQTRYSQGQ